ncbi:MlaD family protein [Defluviimonas sp. WL0024]|uniref:MlaD family protein n=2 Tax=Albidovulum TaxID=205889 RepID=A0ABT3J2B0_9RHOB|nr:MULTISPECIES: MlaD family protein [Defluviimonas]MCU9847781.1 MlaD family protein [Defluviimonas sp. WL0024]MCW3781791.1 MlaD family protein [Defluviimonas salinarum]
MTDPRPAELDISPPRPSFWRNLSFVWLVPVLALAISLGLAWQNFANRGVLVEITFLSAPGVTAGETTIRYRDVTIGRVEQVTFTPDLTKVLIRARIDKEVATFLDKDAQFWIVSPKVSTRGISGLSTVLSGVYIEGAWDQEPGVQAYRFDGADGPPLVQPGRDGKRITLITDDGSLISEGAPVFFHGVEVGRLEKPRLTVTTDSIVVDAFIEAPHDRRLNSATRFWDTSGFEVSLSGAGLSVNFDSMASLLAGGVEFDSVYEGGEPVSPGHVFQVYPDQASARKSLIARSSADAVQIAAEFGESVSGLEPGADVRYGGLKVGEVVAIAAQVEEDETGPNVRLMANLAIEPDRLGLPAGAGKAETLDFFEAAVDEGLRARLAATSIFSAALIVELVEIPDAAPAVFERAAEPLPILPSEKSNLPDFTATAEGVFERINALPIEELIEQAITMMASIEAVTSSESTRAVPDTVVALLEDTRSLVNDEAMRALPGDIRATVAELRAVVSELKEGGAMKNLASALERADKITSDIATASAEFPALVEDLRAVAKKANSLEAEELVAAATRVLDSADKVIGSEAARDLPPVLNGALDEIRTTLAELREGGAVENANATMASARDAADAVAKATESLPDLSARLEKLVTQSEALIAAYGERSDFNGETLAALREVRSAARAVSQLARAIERNPNSLLIGR